MKPFVHNTEMSPTAHMNEFATFALIDDVTSDFQVMLSRCWPNGILDALESFPMSGPVRVVAERIIRSIHTFQVLVAQRNSMYFELWSCFLVMSVCISMHKRVA